MSKQNRKRLIKNLDEDIRNLLFKLRVKLPGGKNLEHDFSGDFTPEYERLEEQLEETPQMLAFFGAVLSEQKHVCNVLELKIARRRAVVSENAREDATNNNMKIAKYVLDEIADGDDELLRLQTELLVGQRTLGKLYYFVDSIRMKTDNLRSLAGFKRQEMRDST
jgi:hypothetical protein